uniref:Myotubularin-related protein 8 n=1 Tax=Cacopsylla melanoneura TaxID=428564 RepID=A0A8D8TLR8_9HEMI
MSTKPVAKHGHIGLLIIESKSNQLKSGKSTGSEKKSGKSVFKDLKSGNSVFKEELKSDNSVFKEELKSRNSVFKDLESGKGLLKGELKSGKVLLLEDLKSSKGALKEDLKSGKVAWFDEIIMEAAEEMLSPLFTMPPSSACFYRVSSSLTNSPSVYDKLKTWLNQKSVEEPEVNTLLTSTPTREGNPILKSVENVRMLNRADVRKPFIGTLNLNTSALIFQDRDCKKETWIFLMHIASIEKGPLSTTGSPLIIRCKTFLSVTFVIPRERECYDIYVTLQKLSRPVQIEDLYCFSYIASESKSYGWDFFSIEQEFKRMQVPNNEWCLTNLNKNYELCDTYPRYIYVPASATTSILMGSSKFRSKGRLPVLTYLHRSNQAVICRCSQPLSGFSARCLEDEQLLNCILGTNPGSNFMYVVDTRPRINAMANRAAGKGYENENFYENIKFHFFGIENIHVMRSSLAKLVETCEAQSPSVNSFLSGLDSSGWLRHVKSCLDTAWFIAQAIVEGVSVVVHCSDGWDRTVQVCSLASLMLDPYYRTIKGYQTLIEKDWLSFGHKFTDRVGHLAGDPREMSPVFTQFLEATWQLSAQFPRAFEFNERFLLTLQDHVTSCRYGTFVGNCEKDRLDLR